jgi:nitrate/nitrite transport system substrate-binding protein
MGLFNDPYDADSPLTCACGYHASQAEHDAAIAEDLSNRALESALLRALFQRRDDERRRFLRATPSAPIRINIKLLIKEA